MIPYIAGSPDSTIPASALAQTLLEQLGHLVVERAQAAIERGIHAERVREQDLVVARSSSSVVTTRRMFSQTWSATVRALSYGSTRTMFIASLAMKRSTISSKTARLSAK